MLLTRPPTHSLTAKFTTPPCNELEKNCSHSYGKLYAPDLVPSSLCEYFEKTYTTTTIDEGTIYPSLYVQSLLQTNKNSPYIKTHGLGTTTLLKLQACSRNELKNNSGYVTVSI